MWRITYHHVSAYTLARVAAGTYWKRWNMPVHKWMLRHVYFPALHAGVPRMWAGTLVFAVSATFHELLIGLPLHMVRCWAFVGVMSQARRRPGPVRAMRVAAH